MIFVTVGTHEQQFNRLLEAMDSLKSLHSLNEKVICQTGYSTYSLKYCEGYDFLPYQQMDKFMSQARIVITHGGPSSFMMALRHEKLPIVVPRRAEFHEHVNDHQLTFCREVESRMHNIILVEDTKDLWPAISNYAMFEDNHHTRASSRHNTQFNNDLADLIKQMTGNDPRLK
ncbi:glycosyltransferase [Lacticaseibacillus paracasei]|uniref:Glycosyltransferase n=1 Tax=Lacticaseibacillus paracasei TaxID=1597 RepID=A0AAW6A7P4_LACPA|nr:glycosyltransferase [Lacticaseibacillus paracasei]MDB1565703.1 glycosyltransferase [Lacticaseibacillus paracasei]